MSKSLSSFDTAVSQIRTHLNREWGAAGNESQEMLLGAPGKSQFFPVMCFIAARCDFTDQQKIGLSQALFYLTQACGYSQKTQTFEIDPFATQTMLETQLSAWSKAEPNLQLAKDWKAVSGRSDVKSFVAGGFVTAVLSAVAAGVGFMLPGGWSPDALHTGLFFLAGLVAIGTGRFAYNRMFSHLEKSKHKQIFDQLNSTVAALEASPTASPVPQPPPPASGNRSSPSSRPAVTPSVQSTSTSSPSASKNSGN